MCCKVGPVNDDLTTLTPVEIDRVLSANYDKQIRTQGRIGSEARHLDHLKARLAKGGFVLPQDIEDTAASLEGYRQELRDLIAASAPYHAEFSRRGGWFRYYLVKNTNGHVHRELHCSTCFPTTEYGWLVDLAACDESLMIEEWGELACTVCFPSAPVNPNYHRPARRDREAQEARAAEKAARDAAKAAKSIVDIDGSPLKDSHGYVLKTKVAARNEFSGAFNSLVYYGLDHPQDFAGVIRRLAPALVAADIDIVKVATNAIKRAIKESAPQPHNPYRLTQEQLDEGARKVAANTLVARALLAELQGEVVA